MPLIPGKKRILIKKCLVGVALCLSTFAFAAGGGQDGGGGGVIRCEKTDQIEIAYQIINGRQVLVQIPPKSSLPNNREFELVDLWEAENGYGPFNHHKLTIPFDNETPKEILIENALKKLEGVNENFAKQVRYYHQYITKRMIPVKEGDYVIAPEDTDIRFLPIGCRPLGFGAYSDRENNLVYDPKIMQKVPMIDRAAFEMHEAVYKYLRMVRKKPQGSWDARRIVGLMFSTEPFTTKDLTEGFK